MIKLFGNDIINAYTGGEPVQAIYSYGELVWSPGVIIPNYLKFTAREGNSTVRYNAVTNASAEYSLDGINFQDAAGVTVTLSNVGDAVYYRGVISGNIESTGSSRFTMTGKIQASGSVMSMYNNDPTDKVIEYDSAFIEMFSGCTSLTSAPKLPATTLAPDCYGAMFAGCTSLTSAPKLPATTLSANCYYGMFYGCTSLTTTPELPATTLSNLCYDAMFYGCTSLTTTPELPATTLAPDCYWAMFEGCTSLTTAPELPATTLSYGCYSEMFSGCTSLTTAPELPATTLADLCYSTMFSGCTSLTTAPELPATTLAPDCYGAMFYGCTSLTSAPKLPATTLSANCYRRMFYGCYLIDEIKADFLTRPGDSYTSGWLNGVSSTGRFIPNPEATWVDTIERGSSTIPVGWTIYTPPPFNFNTRVLRNMDWSTDFTNLFDIKVTETSPKHYTIVYEYIGDDGWHPQEASCQIYNIIDNPWYTSHPTYSCSWGGNIWEQYGYSLTSEGGMDYDHIVVCFFNDYGHVWYTGDTFTIELIEP